MDSPDLRELSACIERVHATDDLGHTLADGVSDHLSRAWHEWDGEDTESSFVLGVFSFYRYLAAHEPTDMRLAVMALTPCLLYDDMALPPDMLPFLTDYGVCEAELLRQDARHSPDPVAAARAAHAWRRIGTATQAGHPNTGERETALLRSLRLLAARQGDTAEPDRAIAQARKRLAPPGRRKRFGSLLALCEAFEERYEATGNVADHEAALQCAEELATFAAPGDPTGRRLLFSYGEKLYQRFLRNVDGTDLQRAIAFLRESVTAPDPELPTRLLILSRALSMGFSAVKDPAVLEEAIAAAEQAEAQVRRDHKDYPLLEWHLAMLYFQRYGHAHCADDLDKATAAVAEANMCLPREVRLTALSADIEFAHSRCTVDTERLHRALLLRERVVRKTPPDDAFSLAEALYQLSQIQMFWYRRMGSLGHLDDATTNGQAALNLLAANDSRRSRFLCGLGYVCFTRFSCHSEPDALPEAVHLFRRAVASAPDDYHPHALLATTLWQGYEVTGVSADLDESITSGERALKLAPADQRADVLLDLSAAHRLRYGSTRNRADLHRAEAALTDALGLPGLPPRARMQITLEQAELASLPPANPAERLRAYEEAVGLLPHLALRSRYYEDREFVLGAHSGLGAKAADAAVAVDRPDRALELQEKARGILADTLRDSTDVTARDLCRSTARGPVVTVSAVETGGLALVVTPSGVRPISLPGLTLHEARARHTALQRALASQARDDALDVLRWLWHTVCRPVLETLNATDHDGSRVWWCPVGIMSLFPLHAAGDGHDSVMATTVSSYLPTVRALPATRPTHVPLGKALVVAMSRTPGQAFLPGAASEVNTLTRLLDATVLHNEQATCDAVLAALPDTRIAHFACHAQADTREPTQSRLLLFDEPLTPRNLPGGLDADLAYLSACATSDVLFIGADEAMHMTAAFQLAGFRHVIGTLWPVDDRIASDITDRFYTLIAAHGTDHAAQALHTATTEVRQAHPDRPDLWASHLHTGP